MAGDPARRFEFKAGQRIFAEGEPADFCYQVFWGKVQITLASSGNVEPLAAIGPGEVFGEMGIIDDGPRSATAVAVEDTMCVAYTAASLLEQMERDPSTTVEIMKTLIRRLRDSNRRLGGLGSKNSPMSGSRIERISGTHSGGIVWGWISSAIESVRQRVGSK